MQWNLFACFMSARSMHGSSRHCLNCGNGSAKRDCRAGSRAGPSRPSVYADERNHARESFRCPWGCPGKDFQWVRLQECPASDRACVMLLFICPRFWTAMSVTPRFWTAMLLPQDFEPQRLLLQDFEPKARASQKNASVISFGLWSLWPWPRPPCQFTMTPCLRPFARQSARASQTERFGWWCTIWKFWCSISATWEKGIIFERMFSIHPICNPESFHFSGLLGRRGERPVNPLRRTRVGRCGFDRNPMS